jgi:hypothetical protein
MCFLTYDSQRRFSPADASTHLSSGSTKIEQAFAPISFGLFGQQEIFCASGPNSSLNSSSDWLASHRTLAGGNLFNVGNIFPLRPPR